MPPDLASVLGRQEAGALEFKREPKDRDALRKAVCALANDLVGAGGGDLLIGVDKYGKPYPVDTSDDALLQIAQLRDDGRILPLPSMVVSVEPFDGQPVVRVRVSAAGAPPVRFDGVAWVRPGPLTKRATSDDERVLSERRRAADLTFDLRPVPEATLADLDLSLIQSSYLPAAVDPDVLAENGRPLQQQLRSLRLVDAKSNPTVLGILIGALDPSPFLPGAYVQFVRLRGRDLDAPIGDEEELRGNLITVMLALQPLLQANVTQAVVAVDDLTERPIADYPLPALREALANALMHRSYEGSNAPVRVLWFDDRIEISNPGGPFGTVTDENFGDHNDYRNPNLAAAMKTLGYVNRFGRGVERMRLQMDRNGNPPPEFAITASTWTVVLRRRKANA